LGRADLKVPKGLPGSLDHKDLLETPPLMLYCIGKRRIKGRLIHLSTLARLLATALCKGAEGCSQPGLEVASF
jgi:hypothetical protein